MPNAASWRHRPSSRRRRLATSVTHAEYALRIQSMGRAHQCYHFFADFWESTPHPFAQMFLVLGWAVIVVIVNDSRMLKAGVTLDAATGKAMTTILAFLIVFRTNQSYNRWWEGRILWGKMHWSCVELTQQAATWIDNPRLALRMMNFAIAYAYTVKQILRKEKLHAEDLEGIIEPSEVAVMNRLSVSVMPYYCIDVLRQCTKKGLGENPQTFGGQAVARGIDVPVSQLAGQYADMSRVRNTPQPATFRVMLHMFTVIYLLLLPVISYDTLGLWVVPEVLLTSYLMLGLQLAATHLEDPFGRDLSDLKLDEYMACIISQCREAFYFGVKGGRDLTLDPVEAKADATNADPAGKREEGGGGGGGSAGRSVGGADTGEKSGGGDSGGGGGGRVGEGSPSTEWQTTPSPVAGPPPSVSPSGSISGTTGDGGGGGVGVGSRLPPTPYQKQQTPLREHVA